jgi:CheY-like chemotaxis protein/HPt (histidine-containing phosphotransfer) domain-containing protein/two-component sensor histidine kinase
MSHEIRTPMNGINGFSDMLAQEELTHEQQEYVDIIRDSGKNLLTIINDILDFSKIEAGKMDTEIIDCSLEKILNNVGSMLRPSVTKKGLDFKVLHKTKLPANIRTDPTRLYQCLTNLINNAVKFTEKGHVHVMVSLEEYENEPFVRFDVEDTGIGVPADKQDKIFNAFSQADNSTTRKFGGTGLGLTITRRLMEILGGKVTLQSESGKGSVFSLVIPAGVDVTAQPLLGEGKMKEDTQDTLKEEKKLSGMILVAEDNPANQKLIQIILKKMGLDLVIAEDGRQAVDKALGQSFDLILMDMQMPNMNGYEATKVLRENNLDIPIIALTASAMKEDAHICLSAGCDAYLSKPIDRKKLNEILERYLPSSQKSSKTSSVPAKSPLLESDQSNSKDLENIMNAENQNKIMIDLTVLMEMCGDQEIIQEITTAFCGDTPQSIEKIIASIRDKDFANLELYAHRIKGGSATIGAKNISEKAAQLEKAGRDSDFETAQSLIAHFQTEIESLLKFLADPDWIEKAKAQTEPDLHPIS